MPFQFTNTQPILEQCLAKWQKILGLQDWRIEIQPCRQREVDAQSRADIRYSLAHRWARIRVVDPDDYADSDLPVDPERCLVHELLHLHVDPAGDTSLAEEQALNALAFAFVELDRMDRSRRNE